MDTTTSIPRGDPKVRCRWLVVVVLVMVFGATGVRLASGGQEEEERTGWFGSADVNFVCTGGNAEAKTFGFRNTLKRRWGDESVTVEGGAIRAASTKTTRTAIGPSLTDFAVTKQSVTTTTAENYFARGRYDYQISERALWYGGTGWSRNTFAGIASRYSVVAGLGTTWWDSDAVGLRTDYALTYTLQKEVISDPATADAFVGVRVSWGYRRRANDTTTFESALIADENLEDRSDFRLDLTTSMTTAVTGPLALKLSWQLLYDSRPSLVGVPLQFPSGTFTGGTVFTKLNKLDNLYTLALVFNF